MTTAQQARDLVKESEDYLEKIMQRIYPKIEELAKEGKTFFETKSLSELYFYKLTTEFGKSFTKDQEKLFEKVISKLKSLGYMVENKHVRRKEERGFGMFEDDEPLKDVEERYILIHCNSYKRNIK